MNGWRRADRPASSTTVHVLPIDDTRDHVETPQCWCRPRVERVETYLGGWGTVITHHSADGRELQEPARVQ